MAIERTLLKFVTGVRGNAEEQVEKVKVSRKRRLGRIDLRYLPSSVKSFVIGLNALSGTANFSEIPG